MALLDYKCPNCGGAIQFNPGTQELACPYCDSVMDIEALRALDEDLAAAPEAEAIDWGYNGSEWREGEGQGMAVYSCNSCSGENFIFAMNGQTGKFVGDLPLDKAAYKSWLLKLFGMTAAALLVITQVIAGLL